MNLFELFVKIGVKDEASKNVSSIASKLGSGLKTAAKIGTAAVGAASAAIVGLAKQSIESYAEYEQLVGGAQLMFGKAYDTVAKNAQKAYKTVQMSQNEYLQQVNGFATGLKTSLGGNEKAAAQLADRIVTAEADIIAATGNAAENVQNAFNGIMRSNFTMLDNLQIGITPTKEGFQDLIDKVNDWNATNGKATKYQMGNLADMQNALVDYIDMVGYSGYAQAEASKTIQGSLASTKSAWSNLLTGLADDEADFESLVKNFVSSVAGDGSEENPGLFGNILPRIKTALDGVGELIDELFPVIVDKIPVIITDMLPKLAESVVKIVESLMNGISQNQDTLLTTAFSVIMTLVNGITSLLPQILQLGLNLIVALATGIAENVDTLLPAIIDTVIGMYEMLTNPEQLSKLLDAALVLITELAFGLVEAIPQLTDSVLDIVVSLVTFLTTPENLAKLVNAAIQLVIALGGGLIAAIPRLLFQLGILIRSVIENILDTDWGEVGKNIIDGLLEGLKKAWESIKTWFTNAWDKLFGNKSVDVSANVIGGDVDGSHAGGLDYVPFDGYVAELHKGEQVLTAEEARDYKRGGKVVSVVQNIYSQAKTAADLMQEARYQQERAVLFGV